MTILNQILLILTALVAGFAAETVYRQLRSSSGPLVSRKYGITELAFGFVTIWAILSAPMGALYQTVLFGWLLVMLARIDIERFILPDILNITVLILGASLLIEATNEVRLDRILGAAIGFALFVGLDWLYTRYRGRSGLGRGDAKLIGALGLWVGATSLPTVILISSGTAILFLLVMRGVSGKGLDGDTPVAFGPALALAGWVTWLYGPIGI